MSASAPPGNASSAGGLQRCSLSCQSFTAVPRAPPTPPLLYSPASFPSLCLHLHPLSLLLLLLLAFCQLCIALNSMEHVRLVLTQLPRDLDWQGVERAMEESCGLEGKEQVYKALNGQLYNMDLDLQREAKHLITLLSEKVGAKVPSAAMLASSSSK